MERLLGRVHWKTPKWLYASHRWHVKSFLQQNLGDKTRFDYKNVLNIFDAALCRSFAIFCYKQYLVTPDLVCHLLNINMQPQITDVPIYMGLISQDLFVRQNMVSNIWCKFYFPNCLHGGFAHLIPHTSSAIITNYQMSPGNTTPVWIGLKITFFNIYIFNHRLFVVVGGCNWWRRALQSKHHSTRVSLSLWVYIERCLSSVNTIWVAALDPTATDSKIKTLPVRLQKKQTAISFLCLPLLLVFLLLCHMTHSDLFQVLILPTTDVSYWKCFSERRQFIVLYLSWCEYLYFFKKQWGQKQSNATCSWII